MVNLLGVRLCLLIVAVTVVSASPVPNPDEVSGKFQGDIQLTAKDFGRNGLIARNSLWINRVIPYVIEGHVPLHLANILGAMKHISSLTCIRFVRRTFEKDYVRITNSATGCWSYIGRIGGAQLLNLQSNAGCASLGVSAHELLHAIGFHHAQSDTMRDQFVRVNYENIIPGQEHNFDVYSNNYISDYGQGYDYGSILHYSSYAFSNNGKPTIDPLQKGVVIGQRTALTLKDANKVNKMYNCPVFG